MTPYFGRHASNEEACARLTDEELAACGIGPDMIRLSIGIEDIEDILWEDFKPQCPEARNPASAAAAVTARRLTRGGS
jgi:hypothetical protein